MVGEETPDRGGEVSGGREGWETIASGKGRES